MALSDMKVFNEQVQGTAIEMLAQQVNYFNQASAGAITLTTEGFMGDYRFENFFASLHAAQRRVDRYATNTSASNTSLAQLQEIGVKVAGGFGPIVWEPAQLRWVELNPEAAILAIAKNLSEAMMKDMLNTGIAAACAAIENVGVTATFDTGTATAITYGNINSAHALFGDSSQSLVCDIMDGTTYHGLIAANLTNTPQLFQYGSVRVVDILGKRVVVTDAPALRETPTTSTNDVKVLSLVSGGITIYDGSDLVTNLETNNGAQRIQTTWQADYAFGVALKGYQWDTTNGGKSPTDAELATGSNWDKIATSIKHTAGVLLLAKTN
jgi:hypothetical protein